MTDKELTAVARTVGVMRDERAELVKDALTAVFAGLVFLALLVCLPMVGW